jgi:hypothetical protein
MTSTHIIPEEPGELLDVAITKQGDTIYLHHNGGTKAFDRKVVVKLLTAFSMVLHSTDRAITQTAARLEAEKAARPQTGFTPTHTPRPAKATLDDLA